MRILHTVQFYHPCIGGSEEVVRVISEGLVRRGHQVVVATRSNALRNDKKINGVDVVEFNLSGNEVKGYNGEIQEFRDFLAKEKFDIMMNYAAQIWSTDIPLNMLDYITAKKVIVPCGYSELYNPQYGNYFATLPEKLRKYDKIIYLSNKYRDKDFGDKHAIEQYCIIPNGADYEEFTENKIDFRKKYGIKQRYILLCVANFYRAKGHDFVLDAFLKARRNDTALIFIGNPPGTVFAPYNIKMQLLSKFYNNVYIFNNVPREDVIGAYNSADLFVFGSKIECSPLVIFESMAAGIPFVSTDCGNVRDMNDYGEIIGSTLEMADSINRFLNDEAHRRIMGANGKQKFIESFTWERIVNQYEQVYKEVLDG